MQKISIKFIYLFSLSTTLLTFLFLLLSHYLTVIIMPSFTIQLAIFLTISIIFSLVLAVGITVFDPVISEALRSLHKYQRIENLSNPLLIRLSVEAAGTFHHSLNVSNLAQKAAKSIGADSFLVRVAAYYHDIGKLASPNTYIENQSSEEIPHDYSSEYIKKTTDQIIHHAKDGIEIARKNNLPEEIIDLIAQHHGTTPVLFFYEKAKEQGLKFKKTDFRYPGPLPLSKEAGILMLADSVEATTRAQSGLTKEKISEVVSHIIADRIDDKQLKNSNLNEADLARIKSSFESTLFSIYHQRIAYKKNDQN